MLLVTENAPSNRRGYYGAYAQAGAPVGVILANLAFISVSSMTTEESFLSWGWRIPFLISFVLVIISMYIQLKLEDTKAFKELEANNTNAKVTGSGEFQVVANESLMARITGSGDINYSGNPSQIDKKVTGSGDISN